MPDDVSPTGIKLPPDSQALVTVPPNWGLHAEYSLSNTRTVFPVSIGLGASLLLSTSTVKTSSTYSEGLDASAALTVMLKLLSSSPVMLILSTSGLRLSWPVSLSIIK